MAVVRTAAKENLEAIDKKRKALDAIKERMTELTGSEMRQTETLTEEGYRVYRHVLSDLKSADNPKVTRAARIGALLFARHADIYAAAMRKRGAEYADYTAMDYYKKPSRWIYPGERWGMESGSIRRRCIDIRQRHFQSLWRKY